MYYHIKIGNKSRKGRDIHTINLSWELIEHRVLNPYRLGQPITLDGTTIYSNEIQGIKLFETNDEVPKPGSLDATVDLLAGGYSFSSLERDITDKWVTEPPGKVLGTDSTDVGDTRPPAATKEIFVVHGRNIVARDAMFEFLKAIGLIPLEWSEAIKATGKPNPYVGEILNAAFSRAHAVVVLFTPDDEARLLEQFRTDKDTSDETTLTPQPRQNVLFEAGMAIGRYEHRTILVELGTLRPFSDVVGRHMVRLHKPEWRQDLAGRLQQAGCPVNLDRDDWEIVGDFDSALDLSNPSSSQAHTEGQESIPGLTPQLSEYAVSLMVEAVKDSSWFIRKQGYLTGDVLLITNGKPFGERNNPRSQAVYLGALRECIDSAFVTDETGEKELFRVTIEGFEFVKSLANQNNTESQSDD